MNRQLSQGYFESSSRKRPSPAFVSDDSSDTTNDLGNRPEGNKFPKLDHDESHDTPLNIQYESQYSLNAGNQSLSDRDESKKLSLSHVLATDRDDSACSSDAMTGVVQEKPEPTCCFGMVREISS